MKGIGAPGRGQLYLDVDLVGKVDMPVTNPIMLGLASGVAIGEDAGSPVALEHYQGPFPFTGTLHSVTVDVSGELIEDDEATMRAIMARQ